MATPTGHYVFRFPVNREGFERAASDLRLALDTSGVHGRPRYYVEVVFEEVVTNVIKHAYADAGVHQIDVSVTCSPETIALTFDDDGRPFDPVQLCDPSLPNPIGEARIGGLGLLLMRLRSTAVHYERTADAKNRLTVTIAAT